jgi:tRNA pseudouridine13 synthase
MQIKQAIDDFAVEEILISPLASTGDHTVYRVVKRDVTTFQVQAHLASELGVGQSAVAFAALKDRRANVVQYLSVPGSMPAAVEGPGYRATLAGRMDRPLRPTDLAGNRFSLMIRDLTPQQAAPLALRLSELQGSGLPNYFHHQRFGSYHPEDGFIGAHILARDSARAVRAYLAVTFPGDPGSVQRFKQVAQAHWGQWDVLMDAAPKPSNYRSLLTYLRDHPDDYVRALNLVPRGLLSLWLEAYQSYLWNCVVARYISGRLAAANSDPAAFIEIAGSSLPLYREAPVLDRVLLTMPHHRAVYGQGDLADAVQAVLDEKNVNLSDLKARILKSAYLARHSRAVLLFPETVRVVPPANDERFAGRLKIEVSFMLPPGSYATLVVECAWRTAANGGLLGLPCHAQGPIL